MTDRHCQVCCKSTAKVLRDKFQGRGVLGIRFEWSHAAQMAVLSLLPYADKPAVPEDGDRPDLGDGGATQPAQVTKHLLPQACIHAL